MSKDPGEDRVDFYFGDLNYAIQGMPEYPWSIIGLSDTALMNEELILTTEEGRLTFSDGSKDPSDFN